MFLASRRSFWQKWCNSESRLNAFLLTRTFFLSALPTVLLLDWLCCFFFKLWHVTSCNFLADIFLLQHVHIFLQLHAGHHHCSSACKPPLFCDLIWWILQNLRSLYKASFLLWGLRWCTHIWWWPCGLLGVVSLTHWDLNGTVASLSAVLVQLNRAGGAVTLVKVTGLWRGCQMDLGTVKIS